MNTHFIRRVSFAALIAVSACSDQSTAPLPVQGATLSINAPATSIYEADAVVLAAEYRDAQGNIVPNAPIVWSVSDTVRAELSANGHLLALRAGTVRVTAKVGATTASHDLVIVRPVIQKMNVFLAASVMSRGDVSTIGVRVDGPGGRVLTGRLVTLTSDNPNVAVVDASGRVRAVSAGTVNIRAISEGVIGVAQLRVTDESVIHNLSKLDGTSLPALVASDTVSWNGVKEFHEVYLERGSLEISGSLQTRYEIEIRYAEYNVVVVNGQRQLQLRAYQGDYDRGLITYDARGDMQMTSEYIHPLSHVGSAIAGGIEVNFRIAGTDEYQRLFFRREPR